MKDIFKNYLPSTFPKDTPCPSRNELVRKVEEEEKKREGMSEEEKKYLPPWHLATLQGRLKAFDDCEFGVDTSPINGLFNCTEADCLKGKLSKTLNGGDEGEVKKAGAVSNDTIRKYAQFALVISLVALSVNIYSMRKKK